MKYLLCGCVLLIIILVALLFFTGKNKPLCDKCNIILVSLDTLSALHLPCYGYERNTAPNLCTYAEKNLTFLNSYSQAPITLDSHFSIFTSLYPHTHNMNSFSTNVLNEKYLTLAQVFRQNGYQTIFHGTLNTTQLPINRGLGRGFNVLKGNSDIKSWESEYKKLAVNSQKNPKFLFLHTYAVHVPYLTDHKNKHIFTNLPEYSNIPLTLKEYTSDNTAEFFNYIADFILANNLSTENEGYNIHDLEIAKKILLETNINKKEVLFNQLTANTKGLLFNLRYLHNINIKDKNQVEYIKALYDEQIYNMDKEFAKFLKFLDDSKLSANTVVIITSDHGEEFMEHQHIVHGDNLYATSTRVPLIMHIPGVKPRKITEMVQGIDIYPTALSIAGLEPRSKIEGIDLTGIISGKKNATKNQYLLSEFRGAVGIQVDNWRLYGNDSSNSAKVLYDTNLDPFEQINLQPKNHKKYNELLQLIKKLKIPFN